MAIQRNSTEATKKTYRRRGLKELSEHRGISFDNRRAVRGILDSDAPIYTLALKGDRSTAQLYINQAVKKFKAIHKAHKDRKNWLSLDNTLGIKDGNRITVSFYYVNAGGYTRIEIYAPSGEGFEYILGIFAQSSIYHETKKYESEIYWINPVYISGLPSNADPRYKGIGYSKLKYDDYKEDVILSANSEYVKDGVSRSDAFIFNRDSKSDNLGGTLYLVELVAHSAAASHGPLTNQLPWLSETFWPDIYKYSEHYGQPEGLIQYELSPGNVTVFNTYTIIALVFYFYTRATRMATTFAGKFLAIGNFDKFYYKDGNLYALVLESHALTRYVMAPNSDDEPLKYTDQGVPYGGKMVVENTYLPSSDIFARDDYDPNWGYMTAEDGYHREFYLDEIYEDDEESGNTTNTPRPPNSLHDGWGHVPEIAVNQSGTEASFVWKYMFMRPYFGSEEGVFWIECSRLVTIDLIKFERKKHDCFGHIGEGFFRDSDIPIQKIDVKQVREEYGRGEGYAYYYCAGYQPGQTSLRDNIDNFFSRAEENVIAYERVGSGSEDYPFSHNRVHNVGGASKVEYDGDNRLIFSIEYTCSFSMDDLEEYTVGTLGLAPDGSGAVPDYYCGFQGRSPYTVYGKTIKQNWETRYTERYCLNGTVLGESVFTSTRKRHVHKRADADEEGAYVDFINEDKYTEDKEQVLFYPISLKHGLYLYSSGTDWPKLITKGSSASGPTVVQI